MRAAIRKGFADHVAEIQPDLLLLQEIRVTPDQLDSEWRNPEGWHVHWHPAERKGYAGTAIWSRHPFQVLGTGTTKADSDNEGRLVSVLCEGLNVSSVYLPSGSAKPERQVVKEAWMKRFRSWANRMQNTGPVIFGGDLNIAHTAQDIFYAKSNEKNSGFLPHEREWFSQLLKSGWHDVARQHFSDVQGPYSWWSYRGEASGLVRGWPIEYLLRHEHAHAQ